MRLRRYTLPSLSAFAALDFETADEGPDSACAVAIVTVRDGAIAERAHYLIRPPRQYIRFSYIHGIEWRHVKDKPSFGELWPVLARHLGGAQFIAAHNASFDRRVLHACCAKAGVLPPPLEFECTVRLARRIWRIHPTRLPDVCRHLGLQLNHHEALSDAEACARIVISAVQAGTAVTAPTP